MAITKTQRVHNYSYSRIGVLDVALDNSYVTGGYSLVASDFGLNDLILVLPTQGAGGLLFEYDYANKKLKARTPLRKFTATFDAASLAATTARDEAITVTGVLATDEIVGGRGTDALEAAYVLKGARATGADTVTGRAGNPSAGAVDPASGTFSFYLANANMAAPEVANGTDLSGVTGVRVVAFGS